MQHRIRPLWTIFIAVVVLAGAAPAAATAAQARPATGRPVYVTNSANPFGGVPPTGPPNVARFAANATGALTPLGTVPAGDGARGLVVTPDLRFAYVSNAGAGEIWMYRVGPGGALTRFGAVPAAGTFGIAIAPNGRTVYAGNVDGGTITVFAVRADGVLLPLREFDSGDEIAKGVAVTPDGRFLYVSHGGPGDTQPRRLTGFALGADGLPVRQVASVPHGVSGAETVITPNGRFVYVVCQVSDDVFGFRIGADGGLTPIPGTGTGFLAGDFPEGAGVSPDGRRLYVAALSTVGPGQAPGQVVGFTIGADGRLTRDIDPVVMTDPIGIGFAPDGRHVYVSDFSDNIVNAFAVGAGGDLTLIQTESSQGPRPAFHSVTVLPNRGPAAAFSARAAAAGYPTRFDGSASSDVDGRVARYDWDFGDGTVLADGGPAPEHVYRSPGSYRVRLTVTDDEGCSTGLVYTGQVAVCVGSAAATATQTVTVS